MAAASGSRKLLANAVSFVIFDVSANEARRKWTISLASTRNRIKFITTLLNRSSSRNTKARAFTLTRFRWFAPERFIQFAWNQKHNYRAFQRLSIGWVVLRISALIGVLKNILIQFWGVNWCFKGFKMRKLVWFWFKFNVIIHHSIAL